MDIIQILKEKIKNFPTRKRLKYFLALIAIIGIPWLVYFFRAPVAVTVQFYDGITEKEALQILSKYKPGIELRVPPREYDFPLLFTWIGPFEKKRTIEFIVHRYQAASFLNELNKEPKIQEVIVDPNIPLLEDAQREFQKFNNELKSKGLPMETPPSPQPAEEKSYY